MTDDRHTTPSSLNGGQIGIAILAVFLCAACGMVWLSGGGSSESTLAFAPSNSASAPAATSEVMDDDDVVTVQSAGAQKASFAIIVRFDDEPELDAIGRNFRKDPEGSRAKFNAWAASRPALQGLRLERASYSGELVLSSNGARSMDQTISAIEAMDNVAYVEPDYSAQPSKEG